jgi:hypothetical protein
LERKKKRQIKMVIADPKLYGQIKKEAMSRFKVWPSAYASGWLVNEYKRRGGHYKNTKNDQKNLDRWFREVWIDVCQLPKKIPCGRKKADWNNYPYCRPSVRISPYTPKTADELTDTEIRARCAKKKSNPNKRLIV